MQASTTYRRHALGIAATLVFMFAAAVVAPPTQAAVPTSMVVEGFLSSTGGGAAADGVYDVTFSIYNVQSGGTAAWTEGPIKAEVKGGQFVHNLGAVKPLTAAILDQLANAWLGLKIGGDAEMARQPLRSVSYALLADTAKSLACSGCITGGAIASGTIAADKVGFTFAGSKTKGGPANSALDLSCTGCVSVAELKIDGDLDLGGNALKAKAVSAASVSATTVTASTLLGDGSKLTGIKIPSGQCKIKGEVVKGINADGTLLCTAALDPAALPADGIDEISNFLIHNQFQNTDCMAKAVPIPDNNPTGVAAELNFGDYGLSQKLDVSVDIKNSDMSSVVVKLFDPNNVEYLLWNKSDKGTSLSGVWPSKTKVLKGDLTTWVNKNPKGKWRLQVIDDKFLNNSSDGAINKFCVNIQTLSNKKVQIKGDLIVDGTISGGAIGAGTVYKRRCSWMWYKHSVNSTGKNTCAPPKCAAGHVDLGVSERAHAAVIDYDAWHAWHSVSVGSSNRNCLVPPTQKVTIYEQTCSWVKVAYNSNGAQSMVTTCTPPKCAAGHTDLGTDNIWNSANSHTNYPQAHDMNGGAGWSQRLCMIVAK